jgi:Xaa-Pro aminopeptidase
MSIFAERRARLLDVMGPGVMVLPAAPVAIRNNDVEHEWRQDSDLQYLTGFEEPESVLVLTSQHAQHRAVLFLRPKNPERETWDGPRLGVDAAPAALGVDAAFPIAELPEKLPDYLGNVRRLHYRLGRDRGFDPKLFDALDKVRGRARLGITAPVEIVDPAITLHELRLHKSAPEIAAMRRAAEITREAHLAAMRTARPGRYEFEVEAEILRTFRAHGSPRPAYGAIVGSGPNATILHYRRNDRRMEDGDLLLVDAGCEHGYYAADVTRTFPIGGTFTPEQRALYDVVLEAQLDAIARVRPGVTVDELHATTLRSITTGLVRLGLLEGSVDALIEKQEYKPFYMHRTSHWLGMDVHDVGIYYVDGKSRALEEGFVLTVEPGLYVAGDQKCDPKWHGIGIRIEDDVLVTATGSENLTADIPKDPREVERVLADRGP